MQIEITSATNLNSLSWETLVADVENSQLGGLTKDVCNNGLPDVKFVLVSPSETIIYFCEGESARVNLTDLFIKLSGKTITPKQANSAINKLTTNVDEDSNGNLILWPTGTDILGRPKEGSYPELRFNMQSIPSGGSLPVFEVDQDEKVFFDDYLISFDPHSVAGLLNGLEDYQPVFVPTKAPPPVEVPVKTTTETPTATIEYVSQPVSTPTQNCGILETWSGLCAATATPTLTSTPTPPSSVSTETNPPPTGGEIGVFVLVGLLGLTCASIAARIGFGVLAKSVSSAATSSSSPATNKAEQPTPETNQPNWGEILQALSNDKRATISTSAEIAERMNLQGIQVTPEEIQTAWVTKSDTYRELAGLPNGETVEVSDRIKEIGKQIGSTSENMRLQHVVNGRTEAKLNNRIP